MGHMKKIGKKWGKNGTHVWNMSGKVRENAREKSEKSLRSGFHDGNGPFTAPHLAGDRGRRQQVQAWADAPK